MSTALTADCREAARELLDYSSVVTRVGRGLLDSHVSDNVLAERLRAARRYVEGRELLAILDELIAHDDARHC